MNNYQIITLVFVVLSLFKLINLRFLKIQSDIAMVLLALLTTFITFGFKSFGIDVFDEVKSYLIAINFSDTILNFALGILLFAGTINLNVKNFIANRKKIFLYTVIGVVVATLFIGTALFGFVSLFLPSFKLTYLECLLFGAIMSPTDPISALSILKSLGIRKSLLVQMEGESLFNDGLGLVAFVTVKTLIDNNSGEYSSVFVSSINILLHQIIGGLILGFSAAYIMKQLCKKIIYDESSLIIVSFAIVMLTYQIGIFFETSSALATVVMGMYFGDFLRKKEEHYLSIKHMSVVWNSVGDLFNAILFMLIGLMTSYIVNSLSFNLIIICLATIVFCIIGRFIGLSISEIFLRHYVVSQLRRITILTWGGLRGGLSIAIALVLSNDSKYHFGQLFLVMTFGVVIFSIMVQGLTLDPLTKYLYNKHKN